LSTGRYPETGFEEVSGDLREPTSGSEQFRFAASFDRKRLGADFCAEGISIRGVFDKEVRRKPLAFAADAWSYGI
jgi:hypothetical protein